MKSKRNLELIPLAIVLLFFGLVGINRKERDFVHAVCMTGVVVVIARSYWLGYTSEE